MAGISMGAARLTVNSMCDREPAMGVGLAAAGSSASPSPPVKASSPAHNYMESMDISSSTMVTSPGFSATTPAASIAASASAPPEQLAVRACEKCTRSKRKCDKRLPACGRCLRLEIKCTYEVVVPSHGAYHQQQQQQHSVAGAETTRLAEYLQHTSLQHHHAQHPHASHLHQQPHYSSPPHQVPHGAYSGMPPLHPHAQTHVPHGFSRGPSPHLAADALDPVADIESSQIMALLVADGVNWVDAARRYFDYVHPWMSVVHFDLFNARVAPALAGTNGAGGVYGPALAARWEPTPSLALLLVCMHLVTRTRPWEMPGGGTPGIPQLHPNGHSYFEAHNRASPTPSSAQGSSPPRAESILSEPIYRTTKRLFGLLTSTSEPSVDLIQCGILLALLEHGNGNSRAGYRTLAQAVAMARIIGIAPGKYEGPDHGSSDGSLDVVGSPGGGSPPPISSISSLLSPSPIADNANTAAILRTDYYSSHPTAPPFQPQPQSVQEEEQNRALWWGLFILDQFIHEDPATATLPLSTDSPSQDDLLPTETCLWDPEGQGFLRSTKRVPLSVSVDEPLGSFQRAAQSAALLNAVYIWEARRLGAIAAAEASAAAAANAAASGAASPVSSYGGTNGIIVGSPGSSSASASSPSTTTAETPGGTANHNTHAVRPRRPRPGRVLRVVDVTEMDEALRRLIQAMVNQNHRWEMFCDCFSMCISGLFILWLPFLQRVEDDTWAASMTQSDVDRVKMAIGNCVRLIHDIAHGCNADLTAHPERVAVLAPPASHTVCSAMIAFLRLRRLGELPTDGPSFLTEAFKSIEIIGRRWGIAHLYGEAVESKFTKAEWDEVVAILEQKRSADAAAAAAAAAAAIAADAGAQIKND